MIDAALARSPGKIEKDGFFTGRYAINPFSGAEDSHLDRQFRADGIWYRARSWPCRRTTNATLNSAAAMASRFVPVIRPVDGVLAEGSTMKEPFLDYGMLENSGEWSGLTSVEARTRMAGYASEHGFGEAAITYRLKDWGISRQRYWGTPIPMIYCEECGVVPVPEQDLPVRLPENVKITGHGRSPLEAVPSFINATCPKCGGRGRRETDTMDTFVDSSWYFYRYCDAHNSEAPFDSAAIA